MTHSKPLTLARCVCDLRMTLRYITVHNICLKKEGSPFYGELCARKQVALIRLLHIQVCHLFGFLSSFLKHSGMFSVSLAHLLSFPLHLETKAKHVFKICLQDIPSSLYMNMRCHFFGY